MNRFIGIGNLTKDVELKTTNSGKAVATFTIAINGYKDSVDFINCVAWEKVAENTARYCHKGSKVAIEGKMQTRSYEAKDGSKRYVTEIICNNVQFLDSKSDGDVQKKAKDILDGDLPF